MSLTLNRNQFGKPVLKPITIIKNVSALNNLADTQPAGRTEITFQSVKIGDITVDNTLPAKLSLTSSITEGLAEASKALVLDSNRNITGINKIYVNSVYINGALLNPSIFKGSAVAVSTDDSSRPELNNVIKGIAKADKAVILNELGAVSGVNSITLEAVENGNQISVNRFNNKVQMNNLEYFDRFYNSDITPYYDNLFINPQIIGFWGDYTSKDTYILENCYSNSLEIHVAAYSDNTLAYSKDGRFWFRSGVSSVSFVKWAPSLSLFLAVGSNNLYTSADGINWITKKIVNFNIYCIEYSEDLSMFVVGGESRIAYCSSLNGQWTITEFTSFNIRRIVYIDSSKKFLARGDSKNILYSNDCINWIPQNIVSNGNIRDIFYCKSKNIIIMTGSYMGDGRSYRSGFYSKDGGFTFKPTYSANSQYGKIFKVFYIQDHSLFIGLCEDTYYQVSLSYSVDGINWRGIKLYEYTPFAGVSSSLVYDKKSGNIFIRARSNGPPTDSQNFKINMNVLNNSIKSYGLDGSMNKIKIGSDRNEMLSIGNKDSKIINFVHNENKAKTITLENQEMKISAETINLQISSLTLNNGRFMNLENITKINKLVDNSYNNLNYFNSDSRKKMKCLAYTNSSGVLTIPGVLNVKSLSINGTPLNVSDNINELKGNKTGVASAQKFIISKTGNEINGINKLSCKTVKLDNYIISSNDDKNINMSNKHGITLDKRPVGYMPNPLYVGSNQIEFVTNWMGPTASSIIFYVKEFSTILFLRTTSIIVTSVINGDGWRAVTGAYTTNEIFNRSTINLFKCEYIKELNTIYLATDYGLFMSKDMTTWKLCNLALDVGVSVSDFTYSPQLDTMIICSSTRTQISKNGVDFKNVIDHKGFAKLKCVKWIDSWGLFVGVIGETAGTSLKQFVYSYDGQTWEYRENQEETLIKSATIPSYIEYSSKLDMAITSADANIRYTYDGKIWKTVEGPTSFSGNITWVDELGLFIASSSNATAGNSLLFYSYDGVDWFRVMSNGAYSLTRKWVYLHKAGVLINTNSGSAGHVIINSDFIRNYHINNNFAVNEDNSTISIDVRNNRVGLGLSTGTPQFSLQLGEDLAFKPTSTTWATSSDRRLKEDIETADINKCWDSIKNIPLKKFKWKDSVYAKGKVNNREQIGWIAQDVENIIPKAVEQKNMHGFEDCRTLNNDQIIANMYGAIKKLIDMDSELDSFYEN